MKSKHLLFLVLAFAFISGSVIISKVTGYIRIPSQSAERSVIPEYERGLKHVLLSIESRGGHLDAYKGLLTTFPSRTRVSVILPECHLDRVRARFESFSPRCSIDWVPFSQDAASGAARAYLIFPEKDKFVDSGPVDDIQGFQGSAWAQDLFESAMDKNGKPLLLIPEVYKWFFCADASEPYKVKSDNLFLESLASKGFNLQKVPLTFRGGNVLVDRFQGRSVAFCGGDMVRLTQTVWRATRDRVPAAVEVKDMLKQALGVDDCVIVGDKSVQPEHLFHLDQAMVFLGNGLAAVTRIVEEQNPSPSNGGISEVRSFLIELRNILLEKGYQIVDLETPARDILKRRYPANGIPYTDPETRERIFLMPVYSYPRSSSSMKYVNKNRSALEENGYRVVLVSTTADRNYGGIHCLAHVIQ